jgi:hypothetical protein
VPGRSQLLYTHPKHDFSRPEELEAEAWSEVTFGDGWCLAGLFMLRKDRVVLVELRIIPSEGREDEDPPFEIGKWSQTPALADTVARGGITAKTLRSAPLS